MRKVLSIILDYSVMLIGSTIIGLFIYNQFFNSICLVAGKHFPFTRDIFINGLFKTLPVIYMLIPFFLVLYKIRHKSASVATFITYCVLLMFTWYFLFPMTLTLQNKATENLPTVEEIRDNQNLSGEYFRKANDSIYYFTKDSDTKNAFVFELLQPKNPELFAEEKKLDISNGSDFHTSSLPFRDPVLKDSMSGTPYGLITIFSFIKMRALEAWKNGYISWVCFTSLGIALASIYSFIKFSTWRMVNAYLSLAVSTVVIWFNYFYFTNPCSGLRNFLHSLFYDGNKLNFFVKRNIDFPLTLINLLIAILLTTIGVVIAVLRKQEEE